MSRLIRVKATRTFQSHNAGDVLIVEEDAAVKLLVDSHLFVVLSVEREDTPVVAEQRETPVASEEKPEKPAARTKPKTTRKPRAKKAVKNV